MTVAAASDQPADPPSRTALVLPEDRVLGTVRRSTYAGYVRYGGTLMWSVVMVL